MFFYPNFCLLDQRFSIVLQQSEMHNKKGIFQDALNLAPDA